MLLSSSVAVQRWRGGEPYLCYRAVARLARSSYFTRPLLSLWRTAIPSQVLAGSGVQRSRSPFGSSHRPAEHGPHMACSKQGEEKRTSTTWNVMENNGEPCNTHQSSQKDLRIHIETEHASLLVGARSWYFSKSQGRGCGCFGSEQGRKESKAAAGSGPATAATVLPSFCCTPEARGLTGRAKPQC